MGRKRKSIEELKRSGTYRPGRHGERAADASDQPAPLPIPPGPAPLASVPPSPAVAAVPTAEPFPPPPDLTDPSAAAWWDRLAMALVGRLTASDVPMLAQACRWLVQEEVCREKLVGLDPTTPEHGRALRAASAAAAAADRILARYGLTPAARAKLPPVYGVGGVPGQAPRPAVTPYRGQTALDRAAKRWLAAGGKGVPMGPAFEKLLAEERAKDPPVKETAEQREYRQKPAAEYQIRRNREARSQGRPVPFPTEWWKEEDWWQDSELNDTRGA